MDHAAAMRRIYELINSGDIDGFGALLADDFVEHEDLPGLSPDRDGVMAFFRMLRAAFPDMQMNPDDVLVDGDKAVARATTTGTQQGEFMGIPATGRRIDVQLIDIMRFGADGRVAEHWGVFDALGMMQQLGAIPDGPPA
ncbi:MAG TPA: ester cyclase [Miltoncostaeaceae bacterium]|nr:ester cyclase [Miltoncostaeaceae bacterium]